MNWQTCRRGITTIWKLLALLVLAGTNPASAAEGKITIFTGMFIAFAPAYIAETEGYFKDEGLDVTVTGFTTGAEAMDSFRAGHAELLMTGDFPAMKIWSLGEAIGIAPIAWSDENALIVAKRDIRGPADLRGKRIGIRLGATHEFFLLKYLASGGLKRDDVTIVNLAPAEMVVALDRGEIDAFAWAEPMGMRAVQVSGDKVHILTRAKGYFTEWIALSAKKDWARANHDAVVKVLRAINRANKLIKEQPSKAVARTVQKTGIEPKVAENMLPMMKFEMNYNSRFRNDMDSIAGFMIGQKALSGPINWQTQFDASFVRAVDPKLVQ